MRLEAIEDIQNSFASSCRFDNPHCKPHPLIYVLVIALSSFLSFGVKVVLWCTKKGVNYMFIVSIMTSSKELHDFLNCSSSHYLNWIQCIKPHIQTQSSLLIRQILRQILSLTLFLFKIHASR